MVIGHLFTDLIFSVQGKRHIVHYIGHRESAVLTLYNGNNLLSAFLISLHFYSFEWDDLCIKIHLQMHC